MNRETLTPGGSAGAGTIPTIFGQVDTSTQNGNSAANPNLDWISKIAFYLKNARCLHLELAGLLNHYEFYNPLNNRNFSITGWGVSLNALLEVAPRLTLITMNYYSNGGGDYIFGEAPNLIIQATRAGGEVRRGRN